METISFDKLLLKTAFCCMASDGKIDQREISLIKGLCENLPQFENMDFDSEINELIGKLNSRGKEFITYYFDLLKNSTLTEEEELTLLDFAVKTIRADDSEEYSEIKFFKIIRHSLKISDEKILSVYPEIEYWLEEDIIADSYAAKMNQYMTSVEFSPFETISSMDIKK